METYLGHKLNDVLTQNFGPDQCIATVDVQINADKVRTTTENVLPGASGEKLAGVMVREKISSRDDPNAGGANSAGASSSHDAEYQVGRKVEQVVAASGTVRRVSTVVVIRKSLSLEQLDSVRELVKLTVGLEPARGDAVAVFSADQVAGQFLAPHAGEPPVEATAPLPASAPTSAKSGDPVPQQVLQVLAPLLAIVLAAVLLFALLQGRRKPLAPVDARLSGPERERTLAQVRQWLELAPDLIKEQQR
jgi:flagellar M-ring protein FliF